MISLNRRGGACLGIAAIAIAFPSLGFADGSTSGTTAGNAAKTAQTPAGETRQDDTIVQPRRPTGSLWTPGARSMVEDYRARQVGDLLTIVVQESATATSTANTKSSKSDSASFGGGTGLLSRFLKDFGASSSGSSSGQGQTSRTGSLATRLTVVVKEILANGNLVIEGTRIVTINKETQKITLTGTVRQQDISPDNSVSSIQVANAAIQFDGKGTVGDRQKKGIIGRIFDLIF
jgi:flagellar L-ring protein precursor FlgH